MAGAKGRSGGSRVGAGRKPIDSALRVLRGGRDRRGGKRAEPPARSSPPVPVDVPEGLTESELAVWLAEAPHALSAKTLTPGTAAEFADFCRTVARERRMWRQIDRDGYTHTKVTVDGSGQEHQEIKAHPLMSRATALMVRIEQKRVKFRLAPIGKEIVSTEPPKDEWAEFDAESS